MTKKKMISSHIPGVVFNERFQVNGTFEYSPKESRYLPSASCLSLMVSNKEIGKVNIDLSSYIGMQVKTERAMIGP